MNPPQRSEAMKYHHPASTTALVSEVNVTGLFTKKLVSRMKDIIPAQTIVGGRNIRIVRFILTSLNEPILE